MNSVLTMTQRKNPTMNGSSSNGHGAMINALRKLYDPVLEEPVPDFLIRIAAMTRDEAQTNLAQREGDTKADKPDGDDKL